MKRTLLLAAVTLSIFTAVAAAQSYHVELSADNSLASCAIAGDGGGLVQVHMFLTGSDPTSAVTFGAYIPACWNGATWLGDVLSEPWLVLGSTQDPYGIVIAFTECRSLPIYLGYMNVYGVPASSCCELTAGGTSNGFYETPVGVRCDFVEVPASGGRVLINANSSCPCDQPLATEQSTWGRVKSLYR